MGNVIISVVDMMSIGKASSIGWTVIGLYLTTTVTAAVFGCISSLIFMGAYNTEEADVIVKSTSYIQLGCNGIDSVLTEDENGAVACMLKNMTDSMGSTFVLVDDNNAMTAVSSGIAAVSLSDTVYEGIFEKIVPNNIIGAFASSNFAAVVFFAIIFGAALSPVVLKPRMKMAEVSWES